MNTIVCSSEQEMTGKLAALGFDATQPPHAREFSITHGHRSVDVVRTDISEWAGIDLGLFDATGTVLWMVEGVSREDAGDTNEYLDNYIQVMIDNDEPVGEYEWSQIEAGDEYAMARRQLAAWKAQA